MSVSVVIPRASARDLARVLEQLPASVDEIVIVGGRLIDGAIAAARGDCVVALDPERCTDAADITRFVAALQMGAGTWRQAA
jgi:hypothetical protein